MRLLGPAYQSKESSSFLKKRTKKLLFIEYTLPDKPATANKSLLLLFFRKEGLIISLAKRSRPADERIAPNIKSEQAARILRNADPRAPPDITELEVSTPEPQRAFPTQIQSVEATIDPQRRGEPSRSSCQIAHALDAAIQPHDRDTFERL